VVLLVVPHCNTAHLSVCRSRIKNLPRIVCHPAPPVLAQTPGRSKPSAFGVTFAPETPIKKRRFDWTNVSSKPAYARGAANSSRRGCARLSTHNSSRGFGRAIVGNTNCSKTKPLVARAVRCGAPPLQCDPLTMERHSGSLPPTMSADVGSGCLNLPRQGRPLLLGEGSGCAQSDVPRLPRHQVSPTCANLSVPHILEAPLVQPACATIPGVQAYARSPLVDVEVGNDDNNEGDSSGSLQVLGSLPPTCFVKQLVLTHVPSPTFRVSGLPSLEMVTPVGFGALVPNLVHGTSPWGGGINAAHPACGEVLGCASGELVAIIISSKKLVGPYRPGLPTSPQTWVVGHVLENYTCLSSGKDLYDADFGDPYGHQTVLVGDCELLVDI
jgi:hypothetical protein